MIFISIIQFSIQKVFTPASFVPYSSMLETFVGGIHLECCVYNASGPRTRFVDDLKAIGTSRSGAILTKSTTPEPREGNILPRTIPVIELGDGLCEGSLNSEGLPNMGFEYYTNAEMVKQMTTYGKPYILSIGGLNLKDNVDMLNRAYTIDQISAIELNLACPNIPGKPVTAYDFVQLDKVLQEVTNLPLFGKKPLGVKLAPYFDMPEFDRAVTVLAKYPIDYIVTINSLCNALTIDVENESVGMKAKDGFGGLGGGFIKPTALANIRQLYQRLAEKGRSDIDLVAVGGCASGRDAFEFILCGAKAVQVGTCHWNEGPGCFDRIAKELEGIMRSKGYTSIEDFRGKLKPYVDPSSTASKPKLPALYATGGKKKGWLSGTVDKVKEALGKLLTSSPQQYSTAVVISGLSLTVAYLLATRR